MKREDEINIPVIYREGLDVSNPDVHYPGFQPGRTVIKAGTVVKEGAPAITHDLLLDRDVAVQLRDGTIIYTDVYRPADAAGPLPAIIGWSPYGKRDGFITFDNFPFRSGVPQRLISGLDKFEGIDPNWWCPQGYVVVSPDARGAYRSDGKTQIWNAQEGKDGADLVEWVAVQSWCNGKVGMAGTSWLGIAQWFVAAERPPHLAAIAPWEGMADAYRFCFFDGGIPYAGFINWLLGNAPSEGGIEDVATMLDKYPEFNSYWAAKRAAVEKINIPTYVVQSWGGKLHHKGTMEGWHRLTVEDRWLRLNNGLEWPDFYNNVYQEDLRRFFDYFLRGEDNGWRDTPRVRLTVCDFGNRDLFDRAENEFPPARTKDYVFHLDGATGRMAEHAPAAAQAAYDAESGQTAFEITFDKTTELTGYVQAHLWIEADGSDDADIFVKLVKLDSNGEVLGRVLIPKDEPEYEKEWDDIVELAEGFGRAGFLYDGPWGRMRASRRSMTTDPRKQPVYASEQRLSKGEVVELVITFSATAMLVHPGETLRLIISGTNLTPFAFPGAAPLTLRNTGRHVIHTGGEYPTRLILPLMTAPSVIVPKAGSVQSGLDNAAETSDSTAGPGLAAESTIEYASRPVPQTALSVEGTWDFTIKTPIGKQHPVIEFSTVGGMLKGISRNPANGEETPLVDLQLDGNRLTWSQTVTQPIRTNSRFDMILDGDSMTGKVKVGAMPMKAEVTAKRHTK
ncbi:CocE/NonD family hydrolase [Paenibacillus durus]|uniref:CocE/NonD family hydrolase n=1 Tax=Paenibacillus durus TaxID=44251 RepID=UPI000693B853|nr:CocE/NonD family hydrolase [Paenibacillus durus]